MLTMVTLDARATEHGWSTEELILFTGQTVHIYTHGDRAVYVWFTPIPAGHAVARVDLCENGWIMQGLRPEFDTGLYAAAERWLTEPAA